MYGIRTSLDYNSSSGSNHNHSCIAEGAFRSNSNRSCSVRTACDTGYYHVRPNSSDFAVRSLLACLIPFF